MKDFTPALALSALLALAGCGGSGTAGTTPARDAGTDVGPITATDPDASVETYPAGPYGSRVGALFRPFTLTACNREGDEATWRFDGPDFFTSNLTLISIAVIWCEACQNESVQLQEQIIERYAGQGVRVAQILVQNADYSAVTAPACRAWVRRYGITTPELMDPMFVTQPFAPNAAFPVNILIDRCGRIRWREYGSDIGLMSIRNAIDEVLADPRYPACPANE